MKSALHFFYASALAVSGAAEMSPPLLLAPKARIEELHPLAPSKTHFIVSFRASGALYAKDDRTRVVTFHSRVP
jgi:hypothetical protein